MDWLQHMFVLGLPVIEKIVRPILIYLFLVVGLRLAGRRELAQLSPFDLVVLLTLSNTVQNAIIGEDASVTGGIIGAVTLLLANGTLGRLVYRYRKLENLVEGSTDYLVQNGKLNLKVMEREAITEEELSNAARKEGIKALKDVWEAMIDSGGRITFVAKDYVQVEARQKELLNRIDQLTKEINALRVDLDRTHPNQTT